MNRMDYGVQGFTAMMRRISHLLLIALTAAVFTLTSCSQKVVNPNLERLRQDTEWMENLNKWLDLAYVERGDIAVFGGLNDKYPLGPSLYTTHDVVRLLKAAGADIPDQAKIADWVESVRDEQGAYLDPFRVGSHFMPPEETMKAVDVLTQLGRRPEDIGLTERYLLSLEYDDGTFLLDAEKGPSDLSGTMLRRMTYGTYYVVNTLSALGLADKVPDETKSVVTSEIMRLLGDGDFPNLVDDQDVWAVIDGVKILAILDTALVTERERAFVAYALRTVTVLGPDPFVFTSRVNRLLDTAELLGMPEAQDPEILEAIKFAFTEKILPLQNSIGGFGPSETIESLTTSENVILANRLGVPYPNMDRLLSEIDRHWLGNGWAAYLFYQPNNTDIGWTYNGIELAVFSGFNYNKAKVSNFLRGFLSGEAYGNTSSPSLQDPGATPDWGLRDLYYVVRGLKAVNGRLTTEDNKNAENRCLELINDNAMDKLGFWYVLPISREVGFSLEKEVVTRIQELARNYKETTIAQEQYPSMQILEYLFMSTDPEGSVISKDEIMQYLGKAYDEKTGSYVFPAMDGISILQGVPAGTLRPDIFQTYFAVELLAKIGEDLPDKEKTLDFVFSSKQKHGFGKEPTWPYEPSLVNTYAGLMILKMDEGWVK